MASRWANIVFRQSSAEERAQEGAYSFCAHFEGQLTATSLSAVEQDREAKGTRFFFGQEGHLGYVWCRTAAHQANDILPDLEDEIETLSSAATLSDSDQKRLKELKAELDNIVKKKEKYLEEHPEQRKLVYRPRRQPRDGQPSKPVAPVSGPEEEEGELPFTLTYFPWN
jgi:hypothetical protein